MFLIYKFQKIIGGRQKELKGAKRDSIQKYLT